MRQALSSRNVADTSGRRYYGGEGVITLNNLIKQATKSDALERLGAWADIKPGDYPGTCRSDLNPEEPGLIIGRFEARGESYIGTVRTLAYNFEVKLVPIEQAGEKFPAYEVISNGLRIGAGFRRRSRSGRPFVFLWMDDPSWTRTLYAELVGIEADAQALLWSRLAEPVQPELQV